MSFVAFSCALPAVPVQSSTSGNNIGVNTRKSYAPKLPVCRCHRSTGDDYFLPRVWEPKNGATRREVTALLGIFSGILAPFQHLVAPLPSSAAEEDKKMDQGDCVLTIAPSGLAFCDRVVGTGAAATKGQLIKAHYTGKLENGKVFDSSYSRGRPLTFRVGVGEVIKGWDQGILGGDGVPPMLAGGKRTLKLPPDLGYGARGAGCRGGSCIIPPDSTLLFDVEFIGT